MKGENAKWNSHGYYCPICHKRFKGRKIEQHKAEHEQKSIKEGY